MQQAVPSLDFIILFLSGQIMASQKAVKNLSIKFAENEVERARDLNDWKKVTELLEAGKAGKQVSSSGPGDILANFLQAEAKLELWLEENQPLEKSILKAKSALLDVKKGLQLVLSNTGDQVDQFVLNYRNSMILTFKIVTIDKVWVKDGCTRPSGQSLLCIGTL